MQILTSSQIHAWDEYTIAHEPIISIELMERAAKACFDWLLANGYQDRPFTIFCGKGNNGGDGLAIGRMLANTGHQVQVYILEFGHKGTEDFQHNLALLHETTASIYFTSSEDSIREVEEGNVIIDALLGSGLNRNLDGLTAKLVEHMNSSGNEIISIDIPTGLFTDKSINEGVAVKAGHTLTFQNIKLSFLLSENQKYIGELHVLDIGLHRGFLESCDTIFELVDIEMAAGIMKPRKKFSHKGDYGNCALIVGSKGFMGAAILTAKACLRSGVGKLTCHVPEAGYYIMQSAVPEAMCKVEKGNDHPESISSLEKYDAIGIGPGLGLSDSHVQLLNEILESYNSPMVIDADGLNILAMKPALLKKIPASSIITPHTREFERLFGKFTSDYERINKAMEMSVKLNIVVVLKGPYTFISTPGGKGYFNTTGNPGMATGGSGDVLTGIITGLLCQGYDPAAAAIFGVYIHGMAGDLAASVNSQQALIASDITSYLGQAFKKFE